MAKKTNRSFVTDHIVVASVALQGLMALARIVLHRRKRLTGLTKMSVTSVKFWYTSEAGNVGGSPVVLLGSSIMLTGSPVQPDSEKTVYLALVVMYQKFTLTSYWRVCFRHILTRFLGSAPAFLIRSDWLDLVNLHPGPRPCNPGFNYSTKKVAPRPSRTLNFSEIRTTPTSRSSEIC